MSISALHVCYCQTSCLKCASSVTLRMTATIKHSVNISTSHLKRNLFILLCLYHKELLGFSGDFYQLHQSSEGWRSLTAKISPFQGFNSHNEIITPGPVHSKTQKAACLSLMLSSAKVINKSNPPKKILSNHEKISQLSSLLFG